MLTKEQMKDPYFMLALGQAIPLGIQHVLAMFVSNVNPAIIVAGFGKPQTIKLLD